MRNWLLNATGTQKIYAVAFLFFAIISCIASARSLCLTFGLNGWILFILAIIGFFFIYWFTAKNLTKILNSLDDDYCTKNDISSRKSRKMLFGGLAWVAFLWLIFSFPTNTHSMLFFRNSQKATKAELENIKQVLQAKSDTKLFELTQGYDRDSLSIASDVASYKRDLAREVTREDRPGFERKAQEIVDAVKTVYRKDMEDLQYQFHTPAKGLSKDQLLSFYIREFDNLNRALIDARREKYILDRNELMLHIKDLNEIVGNINNLLDSKTINVELAREVIQDGYNLQAFRNDILDKAEVLKIKEKGHSPTNVKEYKVYPIERFYSVFNVWGDYFSNKIPKDFDMLYCILISLILDIVALGFSGAAFRGN